MSVEDIRYVGGDVFGESIRMTKSGVSISLGRNYEVGLLSGLGSEKLVNVYYVWMGTDTGREVGVSLTEEHMEALVRHYLKLKLEMMEERSSGDRT
jgi:hypothetical protein